MGSSNLLPTSIQQLKAYRRFVLDPGFNSFSNFFKHRGHLHKMFVAKFVLRLQLGEKISVAVCDMSLFYPELEPVTWRLSFGHWQVLGCLRIFVSGLHPCRVCFAVSYCLACFKNCFYILCRLSSEPYRMLYASYGQSHETEGRLFGCKGVVRWQSGNTLASHL